MTATPTARLFPMALALAFTVSPVAPARAAEPVKLQAVKYDAFQSRLAEARAQKYKFTLVDAWASNCGPCKENFPHLIEMHRKYAGKGLQVVSLSLDDTSDAKAVEEARKFLEAQKAPFLNLLLDEEFGYGFEKLEVNAIPAVFVYDPDGKLVKKYTLDDPNDQFTYEDVEKDVKSLLDGKPVSKK
ncbi:MAG: TlpA family protein disulfide reductase [Planctomycetia bacterium]|nr:TlpA family protein disulfide reductase [Planctomycetia bacterium]